MHILDAKIISNQRIAKDIYLISFKSKRIAAEAKPGQFLMLRLNLPLKSILRRPFSICMTDNNSNEVFVLYKVRGKITGYMSGMREGESISIIGPLGKGFEIPDHSSRLLLVGGGIGIAPLISLMHIHDKRITLMAGYGSGGEYVDVKKLIKGDYEYLVSTEDGSMGYRGTCVDILKDYVKDQLSGKPMVLSCGPMPMLKEVAMILRKLDVPCYVSLETYMGCGTGLCQGCVIKTYHGYKRVCKEGPVFRAEDICWDQL